MIAMQYKILLSDDFDMNVIKKRVSINGCKTDGFQDLLFKAYLVSEKNNTSNDTNEYSPLYLWNNNIGMNKFIFDGFYDNILSSFGWQKINIGIPVLCKLEDGFNYSQYAIEIERSIQPVQQMENLDFSCKSASCVGKVLIYNPDKWKCVEFYFYPKMPIDISQGKLYRILYLSM